MMHVFWFVTLHISLYTIVGYFETYFGCKCIDIHGQLLRDDFIHIKCRLVSRLQIRVVLISSLISSHLSISCYF